MTTTARTTLNSTELFLILGIQGNLGHIALEGRSMSAHVAPGGMALTSIDSYFVKPVIHSSNPLDSVRGVGGAA